VGLGWQPFLRSKVRGKVRLPPEQPRCWRSSLVPVPGTAWCGAVECCVAAPKRLRCTRLPRWDAGYAAPWLVLTDLPPAAANVGW
jgi:hypothetical protein